MYYFQIVSIKIAWRTSVYVINRGNGMTGNIRKNCVGQAWK